MKISYVASVGHSLTGWDLNNNVLPPEDSSIWVCVAQKETLQVEKPKYNNPDQMEKLDVIRFLFGRIDADGKQHFAMTKEMRQSGFPKSALMQFLTSWLGKAPPTDNTFSTDDLVGKGAQVTISHMETRKGTKYAGITGISPVISDLQDKVPSLEAFDIPGADDDNLPY